MNNSIIPISIRLAEIAYYKGMHHVIISPGSRSAPVTIAFARHPNIKTYVIPDERSAGYVALGMSLKLGEPVGLVCTSGTAAINLYPAIAEAYYQNIPLLVFTADRPPEWIDQADGQTIHQENLYGKHVKKFFTLPSDQILQDGYWHVDRVINETINTATDPIKGPVHLNIPIREPFYPDDSDEYLFNSNPKIIDNPGNICDLNTIKWDELRDIWNRSRQIIAVAGQSRLDSDRSKILNQFITKFNVPLLGDTIANIHDLEKNSITHHDLILGKKDGLKKMLEPDLLITFGNSVVSKNLKNFLRDAQPTHHWDIREAGYHPDTFRCLSHKIRLKPEVFFQNAAGYFQEKSRSNDYLKRWILEEKNTAKSIAGFFDSNLQFSELQAVHEVIHSLPDRANLHLANSMPVRLANLIGCRKSGIEVYANRGVSGIDGCLSTAMGISTQSDQLNFVLIGDMAFFYDRNGLWHDIDSGNLRIILLNNHGGGIFRMIDGPSKQPELEVFFETDQKLNAQNTSADFDLDYYFCNNIKGLKLNFQKLLVDDGKSKILEIETHSQINKIIFDKYLSQF
jgi:2-succinyl-5-enolpyruvyl-6-hydroxy-3-cyclohexene-1-carboxylate synthase